MSEQVKPRRKRGLARSVAPCLSPVSPGMGTGPCAGPAPEPVPVPSVVPCSDTLSGQRPALAVSAADVWLGLGRVPGPELGRGPLEFLAGAVGGVAPEGRLGQPARVLEVAGRRRAGLAGVEPLGVVAERLGDGWLGPLEVAEVLLRQEHVLTVVSQQFPLAADEQHAVGPL